MNMIITISRSDGTGASIIAEDLSKRLGIPVYDKASVAQILSNNDYASEAEVIKKLADEPCVILGRCASDILKDRSNIFNILVCADKEDRIQRIMKKDHLDYEHAKAHVEKTDAIRQEYYYTHTGKTWGDVNEYHMILDTSRYGIKNSTEIVMKYFERAGYI